MKKFTKRDFLIFGGCIALMCYAMYYNQQIQSENQIYFPRPLSDDDIKKYSDVDSTVVIAPLFTQNAYKHNGFYDYYNKTCSSCTVVSLQPFGINASYTSSVNSLNFLMQLHYPIVTDVDVDQHPEILQKYDKVILLHNEYVTQKEFDAITHHKNVIYLYPNALYAKVSVDYNSMTMTLLKGHGYEDDDSGPNGFDYVTSSQYEYDLNCKNYKWEQMPNGMQLSCWPEFLIKSDRSLLETIKDYPTITPPLISQNTNNVNITDIPFCDQYGNCQKKSLNDSK